MSLLTPIKVPVKVYRWDDAGAPALDKTAGCIMAIFKACLITGYGTKEGAGWTMPFEDAAAGVKVFAPKPNAIRDFRLRLSADTGNKIDVAMYDTMTDVNTGVNKMTLPVPFIYKKAHDNKKWVMIVSDCGFMFCCQSASPYSTGAGYYFWAGALSSNTVTGGWHGLQYSGGSWADGDVKYDIPINSDTTGSSLARISDSVTISSATQVSLASGVNRISKFDINDFAGVYIGSPNNMLILPSLLLSLNPNTRPIFSDVTLLDSNYIVIKMGNYDGGIASAVVSTDFWYY